MYVHHHQKAFGIWNVCSPLWWSEYNMWDITKGRTFSSARLAQMSDSKWLHLGLITQQKTTMFDVLNVAALPQILSRLCLLPVFMVLRGRPVAGSSIAGRFINEQQCKQAPPNNNSHSCVPLHRSLEIPRQTSYCHLTYNEYYIIYIYMSKYEYEHTMRWDHLKWSQHWRLDRRHYFDTRFLPPLEDRQQGHAKGGKLGRSFLESWLTETYSNIIRPALQHPTSTPTSTLRRWKHGSTAAPKRYE